ncbi:MAG: formimidoylglutamase [Flavobacteriaceae bacterium]|jgi:formiminoglutamase|nr:formimidoylglutamase [Flavobacteriaceae bacterium]MDA7727691.1 formimidoylglutamase [Flavobacteriaceae bacterium]MDB0004043.1 formimidoylglutamase [Flavobacteriaceae bacterium]MDG1309783.1 formimidoylglutamase [Flavobacteriaceae bacterium]
MNNLQIITSETLDNITTKRSGETKFFEDAKYVSNLNDLPSLLADSKVKFVLFGIKEDIGVLANNGQAGAKNTWDPTLKSLLNLQSNEFTNPSNVLILGHLDFTDLYDVLSTVKTDQLQHTYRTYVEKIDQCVTQLVCTIVKAGKIPILIGGGHNNAYGAIKGSSIALESKINALNFDAHTDLRALEGRHSGNGFRYAIEEGYLDRYYIFGLHENYTSKEVLNYIEASKSNIKFNTFEDLSVRKKNSFKKASKIAMGFISNSKFGIEIDCDAIQNIPSSAQTPSGFSVNQTRRFVHYFGSHPNATYLHICEAATSTNDSLTNAQTGKLLSYLITDFLNARKDF